MSDVDGILETIAEARVKVVAFRFTDLAGRWRHKGFEASAVDAALLREGVMIDGSAVPGWRDVQESDLLLKPDPGASFLDPFSAQPTLVIICDGAEPGSGLGYERDPRSAARRLEAWLGEHRVADSATVAPDLGFYLFDDVRVDLGPMRASYALTASEHRTSAGESYSSGNPGHRPAAGGGYLALPPADHMSDIRAEMTQILAGLGLDGLQQSHGQGAGQNEIMFKGAGPIQTADRIQMAKYSIQQVAASYGKSASFMAKPVADEAGSALHVHLALQREGRPIFAGQGYADLSPICLGFIAGIIQHAKALNAFTNPTTNSYKRLRPGEDEPVMLAYAAHNRSAAIRIPYAARAADKRIEIRFPDPCANPYLAFTALIMAGLDGIERKLEPGDAMDRNLYDLRPEESLDVPQASRSLAEALGALEQDQDFLTKGDVMPPDLIQGYIQLKRREIDLVDRTPHPVEFQLYYGL
jgi:glutamine synthetase